MYDQEEGRLALVQDKGRIELVGVSAAMNNWRHEHAVYQVFQPSADAENALTGPCLFESGALWLSGAESLARVSMVDGAVVPEVVYDLEIGLQDLLHVNDTRVLGHQVDGRWVGIDLETGSMWSLPELGVAVARAASHPLSQRVWMAERDDQSLVEVRWQDDTYLKRVLGRTADPVVDLQIDQRTGIVGTLELDDAGRSWLRVYDAGELQDSHHVPGTGVRLIPPGFLGQFTVLSTDASGSLQAFSWRLLDPAEPDVPLGAFMVTTLEEPFLNLEMPCVAATDDEKDFAEIITNVRSNVTELDGLQLPVAVGVTWEFVVKAQECGETSVFSELLDAGYELGHMVHSRPCFNCTDGDVAGQFPAECAALESALRYLTTRQHVGQQTPSIVIWAIIRVGHPW